MDEVGRQLFTNGRGGDLADAAEREFARQSRMREPMTTPTPTARIDEAIARIIAGGSASYWDSTDPEDGPADAAIVARALVEARQEQAELLAAVRELYDPSDSNGRRDGIDKLLSRFPTQ